MKFIYFKRAIFWIAEITKTLVILWFKNPRTTPTILSFIFEKLFASKKFFMKNVLTERQSISFAIQLQRTVKIYRRLGERFDLSNPKSYDKLEHILDSKFQILYFLVRKLKPKTIVETGVAAGESTGYILRALNDNRCGKLYSIDLPFQWYIYGDNKLHLDSLPAGKTSGYLVPENLKSNWKLVLGNSYEKLPNLLKKLGKIDIFFHDSEHTEKNMTFEYQVSWPYIKKGGLLISDDIDYTNAFSKFSRKVRAKTFNFKDLGIIKK